MKIEFDDGFSFGKGAFETIKVVDRKALFLDAHLKRLKNSLDFFGITKEIDEEKIISYIKNADEDNFALKIIVSDKNFILSSREDNYRNEDKLFKLKISPVRRNTTSKVIYHKSLSYYENILEHRWAISKGFDSALFLNEREEVAETSFANIFFVKDDEIFTPTLSSGLLKGTMRDYLINNYKICEKVISNSEIKDFDEVFISNSLMGVRSVLAIDDNIFNNQRIKLKIEKDLKNIGF